jgi:hypothetical protein
VVQLWLHALRIDRLDNRFLDTVINAHPVAEEDDVDLYDTAFWYCLIVLRWRKIELYCFLLPTDNMLLPGGGGGGGGSSSSSGSGRKWHLQHILVFFMGA